MDESERSYLDWKHWDAGTFGYCSSEDARYFAAETALASTQTPRVLEIGFGNGNFLAWARGIGAEVFGIEANPELAVRAKTFLGVDHVFAGLDDPHLEIRKGYFSHIVAFDVIEHIPIDQLTAVLSSIRDLLAMDGRLILRFPNGDSPFGRIHQHGDPTHITTIGQKRLEYFAREAGLAVTRFNAPALPLLGGGLPSAAKRCLIKLSRAVIERAISLLYFSGRRIPLDPNYVATVVRARST